MDLHTTFLYMSVFMVVSSAYRLSRFQSHKYERDHWESEENPEREFLYQKLGILNYNALESPQATPPPPRPYVGPKNGKYKYKYKKKRPNRRRPEESCESESDDEKGSVEMERKILSDVMRAPSDGRILQWEDDA
ncbi:uncharacterized protein LOC111325472 [Stylophora pistillata]|uniref:Uncharacterized protein n=1 Tax=Stylophora pistillata TaxID=50429 RepID=A0A2B4SKT6_STYPI|nr:uncharacterized protein LOC111325472 [Stylophora pistillata]PFX29035.1 hypothetical protein AWC38_SpisGene6219 [Stylophora pistillata]